MQTKLNSNYSSNTQYCEINIETRNGRFLIKKKRFLPLANITWKIKVFHFWMRNLQFSVVILIWKHPPIIRFHFSLWQSCHRSSASKDLVFEACLVYLTDPSYNFDPMRKNHWKFPHLNVLCKNHILISDKFVNVL